MSNSVKYRELFGSARARSANLETETVPLYFFFSKSFFITTLEARISVSSLT